MTEHLISFHSITKAIFIALTLCYVPQALADDDFLTPEPAVIMWKGGPGAADPTMSNAWPRLCASLGAAMTVQGGPLGIGVFSSFKCLAPGATIPPSPWRVVVEQSEDVVSVSILRVRETAVDSAVKNSKPHVVEMARVGLPPSDNAVAGLIVSGINELVAMRLLDEMPMSWWFSSAHLSPDGNSIRGKRGTSNVAIDAAPEELALYRIVLDEKHGLWIPQFVGRAKRAAPQDGRPVWSLPEGVADIIKETGLWAQNWGGPRTTMQDWDMAVSRRYTSGAGVESLAFRSFADTMLGRGNRLNRFGIRAGKSILPGEAIIQRQKLYGMYCDIKHGPAAGWRLFVDQVPKVNLTKDGYQSSIQSERYLVGFALSVAPGLIIQQIDVTPRVGIWTVGADIPVSDDAGKSRLGHFRANRAGSVGVEAGVELGNGNTAFRVWASLDRGVRLLKQGEGNASARRVGLDVFVPIGTIAHLGDTDLQLLLQLFGFLESVGMNAGSSLTNTTSLNSLSYVQGFGGVGIGMTW